MAPYELTCTVPCPPSAYARRKKIFSPLNMPFMPWNFASVYTLSVHARNELPG